LQIQMRMITINARSKTRLIIKDFITFNWFSEFASTTLLTHSLWPG
jgi:hypothetical protein